MYYSHEYTEFQYCQKCQSLEALARLYDKSFIPCRQCWEKAIAINEPEVDELL